MFQRFIASISLRAIVILGAISMSSLHAKVDFDIKDKEIKQLLVTAENYRDIDPDKGLLAAQEALALGEKNNDIKLQVYASLILARLYEKKNQKNIPYNFYQFSVDALKNNSNLLRDPNILFYITAVARYQEKYQDGHFYIAKGISIKKRENDLSYLTRAFSLQGNLYKGQKKYVESIKSYSNSLSYAIDLGSDEHIFKAYKNLASVYRKNGAHETALKYNKIALDIIEKKGDISQIAKILEYISTNQRSLGLYAPALQTAKRALSIQRALQDTDNIPSLLLSISISYLKLSSYDNALEYALEMLNIHEKNKHLNGIASASNQIGHIYFRLKQYDDALYYYKRTLSQDPAAIDTKYQAAAYRGIAAVEEENGNNAQGLEFAKKAILIYRNLKNNTGIASSINTIADIYQNMGKNNEAIDYCYEGLDLAKKMNDQWVEADFYLHLGELLIDRDINKAQEYLQAAMDIAIKIKAKSIELDTYNAFVTLETKRENYKLALTYSKKVFSLTNDLSVDTVNERVAELQIIQEIEEKEREIEELKHTQQINSLELERQSSELNILNKERIISSLELESEHLNQKFLISIIVFIVIALSLLHFRYQLFKKTQRKIESQSKDIHIKNKKLEELNATKDRFFSIISHDLRGPISSLVSLAKMLQENLSSYNHTELKNYIDAIYDSSDQTHKLLDDLLSWATMQLRDTEPVPTTCSVIDITNAAIKNLDMLAKEKNIFINNIIGRNICIYVDKNMMNTVIRNLLANAIKFTPKNGRINLLSEIEDGNVTIHIKDFGVGISKEDQKIIFHIDKIISRKGTDGETGTGLGLTLCKDLIEKNGSELKLTSELGKGSDFFFILPIKNTNTQPQQQNFNQQNVLHEY